MVATEPAEGIRLQKVLARAGLASRRACEAMIAEGRVTVDGETARLGRRVDPDRQRIELDGAPVIVRTDLVHYLLNKPAGYITTADDPQGRPTVVGLVPATPRVFPVGRLDLDTEGLLVLTNDGELAQLLTHPSHGVAKTYLAEIEGVPTPAELRLLREGVELDDGPTAPAGARVVQRHGRVCAIEVVLHEGRKRQVRRMCEAIGHPVVRLVRTAIGTLRDPRLPPGEWRVLAAPEVHALYRAATGSSNTPSRKDADDAGDTANPTGDDAVPG